MATGPLIRASDLTKTYRVVKRRPGFFGGLKTLFSAEHQEIRAVDSISFEIERGELVGYLGPNGAGKSTTIKMLTGVLHPTDGEVVVDGLVPYKERGRNAKKIGVVFGQREQLMWDLPARDTYQLLRRMYSISTDRYEANLALFTELLELQDLLDIPVRQLSLGQRMRCELVVPMLHDPEVLYLDEPTIGLDVVAKHRIREFILQMNRERGTTVLLTTHDLSDIERLCRRVMIIDKGRIMYDGPLSEIRSRYGGSRRLVFTPQDGSSVDGVEDQVRAIADEATVSFGEDRAVAISFDPRRVSASEITKQIVNNYDVKDLSVEEADIETIVRDIYERGQVG
jgi:ABC-2 type transport system ATP-binding protein